MTPNDDKADIDILADMGVLYNLSKPDMLQKLSRGGLTHLRKYHLAKIMEAAVHESPRRDRSLVLTGLNMFEREADGSLVGRTEPLSWIDWPEFGHLQQYKPPTTVEGSNTSKPQLKDQIAAMRRNGTTELMKDAIENAFLAFLSQLIGFDMDAFDPSQALMMYGIDSLSGVSCQYWFHKGTKASQACRICMADIKIQSSGSMCPLVNSLEEIQLRISSTVYCGNSPRVPKIR